MAALTTDRNTTRRVILRSIELKVKAATTIYQGSIVAVDATGYAVPASDAANLKVVGIAKAKADNSAGADGAVSVVAEKGTFKLANNGVNPVVQATIGAAPQVADDQTVRASGATNAITVGVVDEIDPDGGIWVWIA